MLASDSYTHTVLVHRNFMFDASAVEARSPVPSTGYESTRACMENVHVALPEFPRSRYAGLYAIRPLYSIGEARPQARRY